MISVDGFANSEIVHQSSETIILAAVRIRDQAEVTLKCLRPEFATVQQIALYRQEYELLRSLDSPFIIKAIDLIEQDSCPVLVQEKFNYPSLQKILKIKRPTIKDALILCREISLALDFLHSNNVIHKHLTPENILYNQNEKKIKLIDFEIAGHIDASKLSGTNNSFMGNIKYISPEQTGRVNRTVDYRSDFYSLGIIFYELLTGRAPFISTDSMELIYHHIAKKATPPNEINPKIPDALCQIALKLLEKTPEDRYQSTYSIMQDLTLCIESFEKNLNQKSLGNFTVALDDIPEQLNISERLLERDEQLKNLNQVFETVKQGGNETVICTGAAGTGKSVLVREFRRHLPENFGYFAQGRQNIINSSIPYSALTTALREVCRQLLSQDDIESLGKDLRLAIDTNLELLIAMVPELLSIVGEGEGRDSNAINPLESRSRAGQGIAQFLRVITKGNKVVILHIENLQWIDNASVDLLQLLIFHHKIPRLMIISGYRLGELPESNPMRQRLRKLLNEKSNLKGLLVGNLQASSIASIISESLFRSKEESEEFARTIHLKTGGNPQAVKEFITGLYSKDIIHFDREYRDWSWDNELASKEPPTDSVGEMLARNITKLDPDVTNILQIASCAGEKISLKLLSDITDHNPQALSKLLATAIRFGYLAQNIDSLNNEIEYVFSHEGIQQSAYSLLSTSRRNEIHSRIGHSYLASVEDNPDTNIFEMVNQLNNSFESFITDDNDNIATQHYSQMSQSSPSNYELLDRSRVAQLNLTAGLKAKESGAFLVAFKYLRTAIALHGRNIWAHYDESFELHRQAAEVARLCGDKVQLKLLINAMTDHAKNDLEKIITCESSLNAHLAFGELESAKRVGHTALALLGEPISYEVNHFNNAILLVKSLFLTTLINFQKQHDHSEMTSEAKKTTMRILNALCQGAYLNGDESISVYILKMTKLSLSYGMSPESSFAYPMFGALLISRFGTIDLGYRFGQFALKNLNHSNKDLHCRTITIVTNFVNIWKHPLRDTREPLAKAYKVGMETGDIEFALIAAITSSANTFIYGNDLNGIFTNLEKHNREAKKLNQTPILNFGLIYQQCISNLMGTMADPWILAGPIFDEYQFEDESPEQMGERSRNGSTTTILYILKLYIAVLFDQKDLALTYSQQARKGMLAIASSPAIAFFALYESLALISVFDSSNWVERNQLLLRVKLNQQKLRKWTQHAPENNLHAYHLVEAELARYNGDKFSAIEHYEQAINAASKYGFIKEHAISCELAGRFYAGDNKNELAIFYIKKAKESYVRWGATTKVRDLDREYIELREERYLENLNDNGLSTESKSTDILAQEKYQTSNYLDFRTVLKATQALSGEIILSTLLERLMEVALENAGAHTASLILKDKDTLSLEISSRFTGSETEHQVQRLPLQHSKNLPTSIIQYVARTKEDIVLNDASTDDIFTNDEYLLSYKPKSVLCVPILSQSHLTGILYLENLNSTHTFTQDRIALLKLLAAQAAIAIENAKLYQQLKDSRNKYLSLYENAVEGIFEISLSGDVISLNPAARRLLGYNTHLSIPPSSRVDPGLFFVEEASQIEFINTLTNGEPLVGFETKIRRVDEVEIWVVLSAHLILNEDGKPLHIEGSIIDITERKKREEAEQEKRIAIAATETKSRFLANMSHEIRTPMNAIIGYTNLALTTSLTPQQNQYLSTIHNSSNHLLRVVNDILDISRVESGNLELQQVAFRVNDIFEDVKNLFRYDAEKKSINLKLPDLSDEHLEYFIGDPARISQVLINLVSNALKFTNEGSITISLDILPLPSGSVCLNFSVKDTGIGIDNSSIELIFESFTQAQKPTASEGSGLGLSISKRLVEMMQGHIHAVSEVNKGSNFYFSIIVEHLSQEIAPISEQSVSIPAENSNGQRLLIVEDNEINLRLASEVLQNAGYHISAAVNGVEALKLLELETFFAVLMDLRMPVMDGIQAVKEIRSQPLMKHLPVIALSAGVLQHEVDEALQSGFDHYISKPVDFNSLLSLLNDIAGIRELPKISSHQRTYRTQDPIRGIDFAKAISNHDDDETLFKNLSKEFIKIYQHSDKEFMQLLQNTFWDQNKDAVGDSNVAHEFDENELNKEKAERLMHNVAGVAGNFGGLKLMEAARALEHQLHDNIKPSEISLSDFTTELENFVIAIEEFNLFSE
ncbi:MAG: PAS domain S-box-containing protein [Candidatus Azotimanducaceae bacterium]|jgi:PAS domain S-box-containing protein